MLNKSIARTDYSLIALLVLIALVIYFPVFYSTYAYTDELTGLWQWNTGKSDSANTLFLYGRYITAKLGAWFFGEAHTINDLRYIRIFSLVGWIFCIPVWYFILKRIVQQSQLPTILSFISVLYLLCTPSVTISIGWAACFEMFLANTAGLIAGYFFYTAINYQKGRMQVSTFRFCISLLTGLISLFTYQTGFGFFLIPFLLHFISKKQLTKEVIAGVAIYFIIYAVYYLLYKYSLRVHGLSISERTGLHINVGNKLPFFIARPLSSAFQFTFLFNENSVVGFTIYAIIAGVWFFFSFSQMKTIHFLKKIQYHLVLFCLFGLVYLPLLIVKENYASNRTLFAIRFSVFLVVACTILAAMKKPGKTRIVVAGVSILFILNALYNFHFQFLKPLKVEYLVLKNFITKQYRTDITTVYFIRPSEDFFEKKYNITRSWDEFGVPSTFFSWSPEFLVKQIVFENTGDRIKSEKLMINTFISNEVVSRISTDSSTSILLIDAPSILR